MRPQQNAEDVSPPWGHMRQGIYALHARGGSFSTIALPVRLPTYQPPLHFYKFLKSLPIASAPRVWVSTTPLAPHRQKNLHNNRLALDWFKHLAEAHHFGRDRFDGTYVHDQHMIVAMMNNLGQGDKQISMPAPAQSALE